MDILLELPMHADFGAQSFGICIENKPFAADQNRQLLDYALELKQRYVDDHWHMVYLSGDASAPASNSVDEITQNNWMEKKQITLMSYADIHEWLGICISVCQNMRVQHFLYEFKKYIQMTFMSNHHITEKDHLIKLIESSPNYLACAFEIISLQETLQDNIVKKFIEQLKHEVAQHKHHNDHWSIVNHISRHSKNSALHIQYKPNQQICFTLEFQRQHYQGFFLGIRRMDEIVHVQQELWSEILTTVQTVLPTYPLKQSAWWPVYFDLKHCINWQNQYEIWSKIERGEFSREIIGYLINIYEALKSKNLIDRLDLFHKSKNNLSFADYLYQIIINIHA